MAQMLIHVLSDPYVYTVFGDQNLSFYGMLANGDIRKVYDVPATFETTINKDTFIIIMKYAKVSSNKDTDQIFIQMNTESKVRQNT